jgi:hypothetical protein
MQKIEYTADRTFRYTDYQPLQTKKEYCYKNPRKKPKRLVILVFGFKSILRIPRLCHSNKTGRFPARPFRPAVIP